MNDGTIAFFDAHAVRTALPMASAIAALQHALRDGLDPEADPARSVVPVEHGQLLLMPSHAARYAGVKIASVAPANPDRGLPASRAAICCSMPRRSARSPCSTGSR